MHSFLQYCCVVKGCCGELDREPEIDFSYPERQDRSIRGGGSGALSVAELEPSIVGGNLERTEKLQTLHCFAFLELSDYVGSCARVKIAEFQQHCRASSMQPGAFL